MKKTYLLVLSSQYDRDKVTAMFDRQAPRAFWFYSLPYSVFLKTTLSAREISELLIAEFGKHRHFITEVTPNRWGVLPTDHWEEFG